MCCAGAGQNVTIRKATELQVKLNCMHPTLFPLLHQPSRAADASFGLIPNVVIPTKPQATTEATAPATATEADMAVDGAAGAAATGVGCHAGAASPLLLAPSCFKLQLLKVRGPDCRDIIDHAPLEEVRARGFWARGAGGRGWLESSKTDFQSNHV